MNSWKARRPPAWEPPLRTFMKGTGRTYGFFVPAKSLMCAYRGTPFSAAAAFYIHNAVSFVVPVVSKSIDIQQLPSRHPGWR